MRTLTQRELNRALLARQGLLDRWRVPLPRVVERVGTIQAQYAPSMYVGLFARASGLARDDVTRGLVRGTLVQATLLRSTIHLVSRADFWPIAVATRAARQRDWTGPPHRYDPAVLAAAAARVPENAVLSRAELEALVGDRACALGVGAWVDLVRAPPSGTWGRRRADLFAVASARVGPCPPLDPVDALAHVVRRRLQGFGPASRKDLASFCGTMLTPIDAALERLALRRFRAEDGEPLVDLPRAPLPAGDAPAPVRFLPTWDAALLVHARRTGVLPEACRPLVFSTKRPQSVGTFLVDGAVAGTWVLDGAHVRWEAFSPLDAGDRREVDAEAAALAAFCGERASAAAGATSSARLRPPPAPGATAPAW